LHFRRETGTGNSLLHLAPAEPGHREEWKALHQEVELVELARAEMQAPV
jgi:hypothetical protein